MFAVHRQTARSLERQSGERSAGRVYYAPAPPKLAVQRASCACGGGCPRCQRTSPLQVELRVSQARDASEREVDRVAEHVMRTPAPGENAGETGSDRATAPPLRRKSSSCERRGGGEPLAKSLKEFFEPRFGADFSKTRVHDDSEAHRSAAGLNARAFTIGENISFAEGEYEPGTEEGRWLIAHELAHVAQQEQAGGGQPEIQRRTAEGDNEKPHYQPGERRASQRLPGEVQFTDDLNCVLTNFEAGEFGLKPEHQRLLRMLVDLYRLDGNAPAARVADIEGFTDPIGEEQANVGLRGLRAAEVANYLISELHVTDSLIGPARAAPAGLQRTFNVSPKGRADNRAVRLRLERIPASDEATRALLEVPKESRANRGTMQENFEKFIGAAGRHGLPTRFLSTVAQHYRVVEGESPVTKPRQSKIELPSGTFSSELDLGRPLDTVDVSNAFHEGSHAFLDIMKKDPKWRLLIEVGEEHYRNAPGPSGEALSNRERILQEAIAEYADHRASTYWTALESLQLAYRHGTLSPSQIAKIELKYNEEMKKLVFGYSEGALGLGEQAHITREMSDELKSFIDRELLESKLPDRFEDVPLFRRIIDESRTFKQ